MLRKILINCSVILLIMSVYSCKKTQHADMIINARKIYTLDTAFTLTESMVIKDGKILATGTKDFIAENYMADTVLNFPESFVYPGFYDAHCHFYGYAETLRWANLTGTKSKSQIYEILKTHRKNNPDDAWILGRGWDQNDWDTKQFPDNSVLDSLFPDIPVLLTRIDGHAVWANTKALEIAKISPTTKIKGGEIHVKNGKLTGILLDNAADYLKSKAPTTPQKYRKKLLMQAQNNCFAVGLTSVADAGLNKETIFFIDSLQKSGDLKMRMYIMISAEPKTMDYFFTNGKYKTDRLDVRSLKLFSDGALGSRGACLLKEYSDYPSHYGFLVQTPDSLEKLCKLAYNANFQVNTHAIGDSANRLMLNIYAKLLKGKNDLRWRIEHAQVINENDFTKFSDYSIIPSVQPTHATSDMYWAEDRLGKERIKNAYAYKRLLQTNGWLPLGTDFPVEDINPLYTFYAAVARKDLKGYPPEGFQPENALSRKQALYGMTLWAAKAAFEENEKGSIEKGKFADLVVLDTDLMECDINKVPKAKVIMTIINGEIVYKNNE